MIYASPLQQFTISVVKACIASRLTITFDKCKPALKFLKMSSVRLAFVFYDFFSCQITAQ